MLGSPFVEHINHNYASTVKTVAKQRPLREGVVINYPNKSTPPFSDIV